MHLAQGCRCEESGRVTRGGRAVARAGAAGIIVTINSP